MQAEDSDSVSRPETGASVQLSRSKKRPWWQCWELYPLLLLASWLRLYALNTTQFDDDQANIFHMAYDAVRHGHLVATSNIASLGNYNPPGIIYFLMLPAAVSADPLGPALLTAILALLGVLLAYLFASRYYGRLTAFLVTFLYGVAALPVFYSRFTWQQNLLLFFAPLFIFILYRGAVARRAGWLGWALFLLGLMIQLHASSLLLAAPLLVAWLLAPATVRWRDLALGIVLLLLIYVSYLIWVWQSQFSDISILLTNTSGSSLFDTQSFLLYHMFLSPLNEIFLSSRSLLYSFTLWFEIMQGVATCLLLGGAAFACWHLARPDANSSTPSGNGWLAGIRIWWCGLRGSPYRSGLAVLLVWQLLPLLALMRHSIDLHPHYFILLLPGPFLLMAFCINRLADWLLRQSQPRWSLVGRLGMNILLFVLLGSYLVGSTASVVDLSHGNYDDREVVAHYYNDLSSLQRALTTAEQVARKYQVPRIYINADHAIRSAFTFLAQQIQTPTTITGGSCALLPASSPGPAVLLMGPYSDLPQMIQTNGIKLTQVASSERLSGAPFRIFLYTPPTIKPGVLATLRPDIEWLGYQAALRTDTPAFLLHWRFMRTLPAREEVVYTYNFSLDNTNDMGEDASNLCTFTDVNEGDQLMVDAQYHDILRPHQMSVQAFTSVPYTFTLGPVAFDTYRLQSTPTRTLVNELGDENLSLSPSTH